jgi:uncharacterized membrane protein YphA (DoxX/SURF4 family)
MNSFRAFVARLEPYAPLVARLALGLVFLYFGYNSLFNPTMFARLVPAWTGSLGAAETLVRIHGAIELTLALCLIFGFRVRTVATILFLDLLHIASRLGWGPTAVRDLGLSVVALSIALTPRRSR